MSRRIRSIIVGLLAVVSIFAFVQPASATTVSSGQCTVTANTPAAVYVSPTVRIQGRGSATCNYNSAYIYSLMTILQEYSPYYHTWTTMATAQSAWKSMYSSMATTASYACVNAQFRTEAQVEVRDIYGNVKFRTTPAVSGTFTESYC
jgi:hypothetical protein